MSNKGEKKGEAYPKMIQKIKAYRNSKITLIKIFKKTDENTVMKRK